MKQLILKKPQPLPTEPITALITIEDCEKFGIDPALVGMQTFGLRRWSSITGKLANSIKAVFKSEIKARASGKPPRDMRGIVGLEKIERPCGGAGKRKKKDISVFSEPAKMFIYGRKREALCESE